MKLIKSNVEKTIKSHKWKVWGVVWRGYHWWSDGCVASWCWGRFSESAVLLLCHACLRAAQARPVGKHPHALPSFLPPGLVLSCRYSLPSNQRGNEYKFRHPIFSVPVFGTSSSFTIHINAVFCTFTIFHFFTPTNIFYRKFALFIQLH